uniref:Uncharacterized protein n=1 Tax=Anguilla anguilla TaxID=7936 RepID=A0A0E9SK40_ANGAN
MPTVASKISPPQYQPLLCPQVDISDPPCSYLAFLNNFPETSTPT